MNNLAVEAENLVKTFTPRKAAEEPKPGEAKRTGLRRFLPAPRPPLRVSTAVAGVSFQIARGEVFGLPPAHLAGQAYVAAFTAA